MRLYRYRPIDKALRDLENNTVYFASTEQLNDPIEGYVRIYWQGDKSAWEGLLRNYICSVYQAVDLYLLKASEEFIHHKSLVVDIKRFDNVPLGGVFRELGDAFLADNAVRKIVGFYGKKYIAPKTKDNGMELDDSERYLKVSKEELEMILCSVHTAAMKLCIQSNRDRNLMPKDEADDILKFLTASEANLKASGNVYDKLQSASEEELAKIIDDTSRTAMFKVFRATYKDAMELLYLKIGAEDDTFFYGNPAGNIEVPGTDGKGMRRDVTEGRKRRNWMSVLSDYPQVYIDELREIVYPKGYVACFTSKNDDSAMWGNYADYHKGVCLVFEIQSGNLELKSRKGGKSSRPVKPVVYGGELIERNFFNTLGRLTIPQICTWLTGTDGISEVYDDFSDEDKWRERYWSAGDMKNYRKLKAWKYEEEYRLVLSDFFYQYGDTDNRSFEYNPEAFKGVIFGINTSEYDKKRIVEKVAKLKRPDDFAFYQAEYDDEKQEIVIRKKGLWKLK